MYNGHPQEMARWLFASPQTSFGDQWVQDLLIKCVNQPVPDDGVDVVLPVEDAGPVVVVEVEGIPMKLK